jgi:hypothetical protein
MQIIENKTNNLAEEEGFEWHHRPDSIGLNDLESRSIRNFRTLRDFFTRKTHARKRATRKKAAQYNKTWDIEIVLRKL